MSTGNGGPAARAVADPARQRIAAAAILLIGTRGYESTSVELVCEQARTRRSHFDRCFAGMEDCFLTVHDEVSAELCERVDSSLAGAGSWHDRVWAAGWAAMRFLDEEPTRARFLVVELGGVGSGAQLRRDRILQRIADVVDGGRGELEQPGTVSRCTAEIVAGAIYGTVVAKLEGGCLERGEDFLPELVYMAVMPYLGSRAAEDELLVQTLH